MKTQKQKTWDSCSKYVRLRDADSYGMCVCYTCGQRKPWKQMQAGHGMSGRTNAILFDTRIIKAQCGGCNIYAYGRLDEFCEKLKKELGTKTFNEIMKGKRVPVKRTGIELKELEEYFKLEMKLIAEEKGIIL